PHDLTGRLRPDDRLGAWLLPPEGDLGAPGRIGDLGARFREIRLALPLLGDVEIDPEQACRPAELVEGASAEVAEEPAPAASLAPNAIFDLMIRAIVGRQQMGLTDFLSIVGVDQAQPRDHVLCRLIGVIAQDGKILRARGIYL